MSLLDLLPFGRSREKRAAVARDTLRRSLVPVWERLHTLYRSQGPVRVLFTGCEARAGVTVVSLTVAESLATHMRKRVQLIEANVSRPALAGYLGLPSEPGLGDLLSGKVAEGDLWQNVPGQFALRILSGGGAPRDPIPGELASPVARRFWEGLDRPAYTIVDGGALLENPDGRLLLGQVDAAVLVVRARTTTRREVAEARRILEEYGTPLLGSVLNHYRSDLPMGIE